jgi:hypothetical protein
MSDTDPRGEERREAIKKAEQARNTGKPNPTRYSVWRGVFDPPKQERWSGERYQQAPRSDGGRQR